MKISEVIIELEKFIATEGDMEIISSTYMGTIAKQFKAGKVYLIDGHYTLDFPSPDEDEISEKVCYLSAKER